MNKPVVVDLTKSNLRNSVILRQIQEYLENRQTRFDGDIRIDLTNTKNDN